MLAYSCVYSYYNQDTEKMDVMEQQTEALDLHTNALQILLGLCFIIILKKKFQFSQSKHCKYLIVHSVIFKLSHVLALCRGDAVTVHRFGILCATVEARAH